ncbi:hypothetical protein RI367_003776 [Sorochytrium milnesiophthora]
MATGNGSDSSNAGVASNPFESTDQATLSDAFAIDSVQLVDPDGIAHTCNYTRSRIACPAGSFCPIPGNDTAVYTCPPGFFCPEDTGQPTYCCAGFTCPTPGDIRLCPKGGYCPVGTILEHGYPCHAFLAYCPAGTSHPTRIGVFAIFVAFAGLVAFLFALRTKKQSRQRLQRDLNVHDEGPSASLSLLQSSSLDNDLRAGEVAVQLDHPGDTYTGGAPGSNVYSSAATLHHPRVDGRTDNIAMQDRDADLCQSQRKSANRASWTVTTTPQFHICFEGLQKTLQNGVTIMSNVSGELRPGRTVAIMGPSGAGKSTFVHLLTGKTTRTAGRIFVNGAEQELSLYAKLIGFVPQEDIMMRELTVRDILRHSALMRLPTKLKKAEKDRKVVELMEYLGLTHVADSVIGDERVRGVSGGQRKRVNIGMELVAEPSLLFLDEPTSGLDSSTSLEVCALLRKIAREQRLTVAAVIHSPSSQAFETFDDFLLLGKGGQIAFFGPRHFAAEYFSNLGFNRPEKQSEADFFMDIVSGKTAPSWNPFFRPVELFAFWEAFQQDEIPMGRDAAQQLSTLHRNRAHKSAFLQGKLQKLLLTNRLVDQLVDVFSDSFAFVRDVASEFASFIGTIGAKDSVRITPSPLHVMWLCMKRATLQSWRSWATFMTEMLVHLGCGVFISLAAQNNDYQGKYPDPLCDITPLPLQPSCRLPTNTLPQTGVFVSLGVLFAGISVGANTFGNERVVYWRDVSSGMPTFPYFVAKILVDIPRIVCAGVMFTLALIVLWPYRGLWIWICLIVTTLYFCAFSMVFGGVLPSLTDVSQPQSVYFPIRFMWDISAPRYAIEALFIEEANARTWEELHTDDKVYTQLGYGTSKLVPLRNVLFIALVWQFLALVGLKLTHRDKQK